MTSWKIYFQLNIPGACQESSTQWRIKINGFADLMKYREHNDTTTYGEIVIFVSVSCSIFFKLRPSFPIRRPTKLLWARIFRGISSVLFMWEMRRVYCDWTCKMDCKWLCNSVVWLTKTDQQKPYDTVFVYQRTSWCRLPLSAWSPWCFDRQNCSPLVWSEQWWASPLPLHFPYDGYQSCAHSM